MHRKTWLRSHLSLHWKIQEDNEKGRLIWLHRCLRNQHQETNCACWAFGYLRSVEPHSSSSRLDSCCMLSSPSVPDCIGASWVGRSYCWWIDHGFWYWDLFSQVWSFPTHLCCMLWSWSPLMLLRVTKLYFPEERLSTALPKKTLICITPSLGPTVPSDFCFLLKSSTYFFRANLTLQDRPCQEIRQGYLPTLQHYRVYVGCLQGGFQQRKEWLRWDVGLRTW